uniref:Uncharacterized protein n=1 Tax=Glossina austeni TaxID=7395 RepID=A0A1A9VJF4_GLOAU
MKKFEWKIWIPQTLIDAVIKKNPIRKEMFHERVHELQNEFLISIDASMMMAELFKIMVILGVLTLPVIFTHKVKGKRGAQVQKLVLVVQYFIAITKILTVLLRHAKGEVT